MQARNKYLIVSLNNQNKNDYLINILSEFESKGDSEIYIILKEVYNSEYIYKLLNVLGYLSELHHVNHFIKIFTSDTNLITQFDIKKVLFQINGIEVYRLLNAFKENLIKSDKPFLILDANYTSVYIINKDMYSVYDPSINFPEMEIK